MVSPLTQDEALKGATPIGPNERYFMEKYDSYVSTVLKKGHDRGDSGIDYFTMSNDEQAQAIQTVNTLLLTFASVQNDFVDMDNDCYIDAEKLVSMQKDAMNQTYLNDSNGSVTVSYNGSAEMNLSVESALLSLESGDDDHESSANMNKLMKSSVKKKSEMKGKHRLSQLNNSDIQESPTLFNEEDADHEPLSQKGLSQKGRVLFSKDADHKIHSKQPTSIRKSYVNRYNNDTDENENEALVFDNDDDCSSVEIGRFCSGEDRETNEQWSSPLLCPTPSKFEMMSAHQKKRLASTSGKKGADMQRFRPHQDGFIESLSLFDEGRGMSFDGIKSPSMDNTSRSISMLIGSQSPISRCLSNCPPTPTTSKTIAAQQQQQQQMGGSVRKSQLKENTSFPNDCEVSLQSNDVQSNTSKRMDANDTIQSYGNVSFMHQGHKNKSGKANKLISLKNDNFFRMQPLDMKYRAKISHGKNAAVKHTEEQFPDPLNFFTARVADRLRIVSEWIQKKEIEDISRSCNVYNNISITSIPVSEGRCAGRGVLLSLSVPQSRSITLSLIAFCGARVESIVDKKISGGTLIVARDKSELDDWEQQFREHSPWSVFNHGGLSPVARKRLSIAKLSGYDVVITTFDALKAKELTAAVDQFGVATFDKQTNEKGWYSINNGNNSSRNNIMLTHLHGITWFRILIFDCLGKGSYIMKAQTARAVAAKALRADKRFIFFNKLPDTSKGLPQKLKDNKKQLNSIASALHIPEKHSAEIIIGDGMMDYEDTIMGKGQKKDLDISCLEQNASSLRIHSDSDEISCSDSDTLDSP